MFKGEARTHWEFERKEGFFMKKLWKMLDEYYRTFAR